MSDAASSTVSLEEIAQFNQLAADWWNPLGPMRPLHEMNPVRINWIQGRIGHFKPSHGKRLDILDIGCGAGLASEALARLGYNVVGLDAAPEAIRVAREHQEASPLPPESGTLSYRVGEAESLAADGEKFDVISALEVIEHVSDPQTFLALLASMLRPNGVVFVSTLNRSLASLAVAKFGAEYVLRLLPIGTHTWKKFIRPDELVKFGRTAGLSMTDIAGLQPTFPGWGVSKNTAINYIASFRGR